MAEQRIPNMRGIMAARTKPLQVVPAVASDILTKVVSFKQSEGRTACIMISEDNVEELVDLLHNKAKVI